MTHQKRARFISGLVTDYRAGRITAAELVNRATHGVVLEPWQHPVPPMRDTLARQEYNTGCDLGEYVVYPDRTMQALPRDHGWGNTVVYARSDLVTVGDPNPVQNVFWEPFALPVRRYAAQWEQQALIAPQPSPQYVLPDRYGRLKRIPAPDYTIPGYHL